MSRCSFTPPGEPTGRGVTEGDVRAWRDRHQCRSEVRWMVEPIENNSQHRVCDDHLKDVISPVSAVTYLEIWETRRAQRCATSCSRCGVTLENSSRYQTESRDIVCKRCFKIVGAIITKKLGRAFVWCGGCQIRGKCKIINCTNHEDAPR